MQLCVAANASDRRLRDRGELIPVVRAVGAVETCRDADVAEIGRDVVQERSGVAREKIRGELVELLLLEPAQNSGQCAVGGDPVKVERQVRGGAQAQRGDPVSWADGVVAVVGNVDDVDDSRLVEVGEAFADIALGEASGGVDDAARKTRCSDGQQDADHFGSDAETEEPPQPAAKLIGSCRRGG